MFGNRASTTSAFALESGLSFRAARINREPLTIEITKAAYLERYKPASPFIRVQLFPGLGLCGLSIRHSCAVLLESGETGWTEGQTAKFDQLGEEHAHGLGRSHAQIHHKPSQPA